MLYDLKLVEGKLVIDLGATEEDVMVTRGYDGVPSTYDTCMIGPAKVIGTVNLTEEQLDVITAEYANGGECGWCGEVRSKLRTPHMFDFAPGQRMCEHCWNHDRGVYLGSYGEDIGPFDENDKSAKCTHCGEFVLEKDQYHIDDEIMFCPVCVSVHEE